MNWKRQPIRNGWRIYLNSRLWRIWRLCQCALFYRRLCRWCWHRRVFWCVWHWCWMFYTGLMNEVRVIVPKRLSLILLICLFVLSPVIFIIQRIPRLSTKTKSTKYTSLGEQVTGPNRDECLTFFQFVLSIHSYLAKTEDTTQYTSGIARLKKLAANTISFLIQSPIGLFRRLYFYSPKDWHYPINCQIQSLFKSGHSIFTLIHTCILLSGIVNINL